MKSYKLVNSREVQEKAFRLGYVFLEAKDSIASEVNQILLVCGNTRIYTSNLIDDYSTNNAYTEITQADFLALPEPFKVGDWVFNDLDLGKSIGCVPLYKWREGMEYLNATKLTPEQIKILGLEE